MKKYSLFCMVLLALLIADISHSVDFNKVDWPKMTLKHNKKDGDPVNIVALGSRNDLIDAMKSAGWSISDPLTVRHLAHEVESIVAGRAYASAPVSALYLFDRKQDIGFEQLEGKSPKHRHHVRFWWAQLYDVDKEAWFGAATYDRSVGLSKFNGEITHHIAPDIDLERDKLVDDLISAGKIERLSHAKGLGLTFGRRNGEGDLYYTDGEIAVCFLTAAKKINTAGPVIEERPVYVKHKLKIWKFIKNNVIKKIF